MSTLDPRPDRLTAGQPAPAPAAVPAPQREAFLLELDPAQPAWRQVVADYLATFAADEPVALVLAPPAGAPLQDLAEQVMALVERSGQPACAEVILLEGPHELLETLRAFGRVHWVPEVGAPSGGREGIRFSRLAEARRRSATAAAPAAAPDGTVEVDGPGPGEAPSGGDKERDWVAGAPESVAINLFGVLAPGVPPKIWAAHVGRDAYEAGQVYLYLRETIAIRSQGLFDLPALLIYLAAVAHREASIGEPPPLEVIEFGSTLFSSIDRLTSLENRLRLGVDWRSVKFIGVEPLELVNFVAGHLHHHLDLTIHTHHEQVPAPRGLRLERSFQATAYGFESCQRFVDWISLSGLSVHGVWLAGDGVSQVTQMGGKRVLLTGLDELRERLARLGFSLSLLQSSKLPVRAGHFFETWLVCHRNELPILGRLGSLLRQALPALGLQSAAFTGLGGPGPTMADIERLSVVDRRYQDLRLVTTPGAAGGFGPESFDFGSDELKTQVANYLLAMSARSDRRAPG